MRDYQDEAPGLYRKEEHDCPKPDLEDQYSVHKFICPDCGAWWHWHPSTAAKVTEKHLHWRKPYLTKSVRVVLVERGYWFLVERPERWQPVSSHPQGADQDLHTYKD